jgi:hypothetical protein
VRYLGLALFSEGRTDDRFLGPLLQRLCQDLCLKHATDLIEVNEDVFLLQNPKDLGNAPREQRIAGAAKEAEGLWQILFIHSDGEGDPDRVMAERVEPGLHCLNEIYGNKGVGVAVIPVRETEAWTLTDGDALRTVFGTNQSNEDLGIPATPRQSEGLLDPKKALDTAYAATNPTGRRARAGASALLGQLGQEVSLPLLRQTPSFARTENALLAALRRLGVL